jgi:serine/threonine protein kinase
MTAVSQAALRTCPRCGATETQDLIEQADYHCRGCAFELAHLEISPSGGVRRVIGWLRTPGDVVGDRYRVSTVLGKGGYAATYLVEDLRLAGKRRALKEIPERCYDEQETQLLGRLHHGGIPDITDQLEADGMVYLVLEFGGTETLESERRRSGGRVSLERVTAWMLQVCDVLAYLHGQTPPVVHRDLKPANMLLDEHDRVMLIDFGIAKVSLGVEGTRTMARAATHGFSPPEQVLGTGTDARSDVYALGATMYALLTGTVPPPAHARLTGTELVSARGLSAAIPAELERLIAWCLELRPEHRPQSIDQVRLGLAAVPRAESLDDDVTVRVPPPLPSDTTRATGVSTRSMRAELAMRSTPARSLSAWARTAATATAVLGLGTVAALLLPWRSGSLNESTPGRVPEAEPPPTASTVVAPPPEPPAPAPLIQTEMPQPPPTSPPAAARTSVPEPAPIPVDESPEPPPRATSDRDTQRPSRPPRAPPPRPRPQQAARPRNPPPAAQPAARAPRPTQRPRPAARPSPPPAWVLIPQPARRTD